MPVVKSIKINDISKLVIWEITETANELFKQAEHIKIPKEVFNLAETRAKQWVSSRLALYYLDCNLNLIHHLEKRNIETTNACYLSVSHCSDVSVALINNLNPCGVDVQKYSPKLDIIKNRFLNENELNIIKESDMKYEDLITLFWTCKEAIFKKHSHLHLIFKTEIKILKIEKGDILFQVFCIVEKNKKIEFETVNIFSHNEYFISVV